MGGTQAALFFKAPQVILVCSQDEEWLGFYWNGWMLLIEFLAHLVHVLPQAEQQNGDEKFSSYP